MTLFQAEGRENLRKEKTREAIALAMQGRWKEAGAVNRLILEDFPDDVEAYNRLGKALMELGHNAEARQAFQRALELSPSNAIAEKNLSRLARLPGDTPRARAHRRAIPHRFIEDSGKAAITYLQNLASESVLAKVAAGDVVGLHVDGSKLTVKDADREYLGEVEPKLALRLTRLINGGNRYEVNITSVREKELTVIIREVFKDPSQLSVVSFPSRGGDDYRSYIRSSLLRHDLEPIEEEDEPEKALSADWMEDEPGADSEEREPDLAESEGFHEVSAQGVRLEEDPEDEI